MDAWKLIEHPVFRPPSGPVCLVIMDGVGCAPGAPDNAWHLAQTPFLDQLMAGEVVGSLKAHGRAVGLPTDADMGNSEVGHNALGAGRYIDQGASLVHRAIESGELFRGDAWSWVLPPRGDLGTLHLIGLLSDGNVHSHVDHAFAILEQAVLDGVRRIRLHILWDGRDVGETSAHAYLAPLEERLAAFRQRGVDAQVASGGGRMVTTMDRYGADWSIVKRGWDAHVHGKAESFRSATEALETTRGRDGGTIDQNLPPFVVVDDIGQPVGKIQDGDGVIFFNFRGDRALEITRAFETPSVEPFPFERGRVPHVRYAGMMQYDGDLRLPTRFLVAPPSISHTMGEYLVRNGKRILACSETQKYGHVTYFFNGNRSGYFDAELERYVEIPSDKGDFALKPRMQAEAITDRVLGELEDFHPDFVRLNFANGDMVGHTGVLAAAIESMEALDSALKRLVQGVVRRHGICLVTADHGNCEEMAERENASSKLLSGHSPEGLKAKTSHTLNPVPLMVVGDGAGVGYGWNHEVKTPTLANLSATCLNLMGYQEPNGYLPGVLRPL
jgi:2,3-bisphosphoglycerate-independent phosphoglycerate mutase